MIDKEFIARTLESLPRGVVVVTGTNGKTTTTKAITELLKANGLRVFTNRTGSNFTRGIAAALLDSIDNKGKLHFDIAVIELDEAYAARFVNQVSPDYVLILNVMRDQLDRFGEIDHTAKLLETTAKAANKGVVLNRDDPRVAKIAGSLKSDVDVHYFARSEALRSIFVSDDELHGHIKKASHTKPLDTNDVELQGFNGQKVTYAIGRKHVTTELQITGAYNFLNLAGALATARMVLGNTVDAVHLAKQLVSVKPAWGRGETFTVNGQPLELVLVKNPAGFRLALQTFNPLGTSAMIAINDNYADGRDMSWLWDVDFSLFRKNADGVQMVSGIRAYDMALRLQYDDVLVGAVTPDLGDALEDFIFSAPGQPKRIFCTYTAMLSLRRELKKYTGVEKI
jgi:UDP-N-acetylmuramyl tripeptide synthase